MNLRVVAAIARKDVVDAVRNRYLLIALLTPLLVAVLFRVILPGITTPNPLTIVAHDPANSRLISELRTSPQVKLVEAGSADAVSAETEKNQAIGGLTIPANFDADVAAEKQPELTVYVNNKRNRLEQARFKQLVERHVLSLVKQPVAARLIWIDLAQDASAQREGPLNLNQTFLPLLLLLTFAMVGALVVPLLVVEEKEKRTLDFLLTSPATLPDVIAGKALTGVAYGLLIGAVLLVINFRFVGNWPLSLLSVLSGLVFIVATGLFMGTLFRNVMQVNTWASLVVLVLLAPSFPSPGLSASLATAVRFIPTYYVVEALKLSLADRSSGTVWGYLAIVMACTVVTLFAAIWTLRREAN